MGQIDAEKLFSEHATAVFEAVYRLTLDRAASEDGAQEAFVRLISTPPVDHGNVVAWLKRVAINHALDVLRRRAREKTLETVVETAVATDESTQSPEPENETLFRALKRLNPGQRAAVLAVDRDRMKTQEAATALGITLAKLKADLIRGRRALREQLKNFTTEPQRSRREE
ncbi:MAG: RNA polymerase sigma factor [Planctomycetes bacterium]|nr:RNA polymerase sigma factor [Planctomycetota bacterium]NUQ34424.1 RNA polymerase sigma factor [Planctomycetaceae bacterium]